MTDLAPLFGLGGIPVAIALTAALKPLIHNRRFWPLVAIGAGMAWNGVLAAALMQPMFPALVLGVVTGLAASGLYSGTKHVRRR